MRPSKKNGNAECAAWQPGTEQRHRKIVFIGASKSFFLQSIRSLNRYEPFRGAEVVAVDIDEKILDAAVADAKRLSVELGMPLDITGTLDRKAALEGADWIVPAAERRRYDFWKRDLEIAERHGVGQAIGENGGPAGFFHAIRQLSMFMDFAMDFKAICPSARIVNLSNPMSHLIMLLGNKFGLDAYGICHGVQGCTGCCAEAMDMAPDALDVVAAGINHFVWLLRIHRKGTGVDLYPEFRKRIRDNIFYNRLSIDCMDIFGLYPVPYDSHITEYLPFAGQEAWEDYGLYSKLTQFNMSAELNKGRKMNPDTPAELLAIEELHPKYPKDWKHPRYADDDAGELMGPLEMLQHHYRPSITIRNDGAISNLPDDAIVDVPAYFIGGKVYPLHVGPLPEAIAQLCLRQVSIHRLIVEAAMTGDRSLALQALCIDPHVHTIRQARGILEDGLKEYKAELPQFWK